MPVIELKTEIKAPKKIVFDLARSIDLHKRSLQHTNEQAISGRTSGLIELNETVTWRAKHFGVYHKLTSKITEFDYPNYFTDEMVNGAFKRFKHVHRFFELNTSETLMVDIFDYEAPYGIFGNLCDKLFLKDYMLRLLEKRNTAIKEVTETTKWKELLHV